jgi:hypothetical protein
MPGQIPLDIKYYPSDFQTLSIDIAYTSANFIALFHADRPVIIDKIMIRIQDSSNSTTATNIRFGYVTSSATPAYSPVTGQTYTTTIFTFPGSGSFTGPVIGVTNSGASFDFVKTNGVPTSNIIPEGATFFLVSETNLAGVETGLVQVRYRSQF